ncbi:NADH-quinone oxidoreductase subunit F [Variovorax sp. J22R115]|uniref:complex I 51 kDa subunit family protein n=1 Tax=Variovorax sp. J22R115 TaxID=3053509 RepID=UPI00257711A6|nr:NADH-ubiquinone oxidoreductase-F iron-sulfur binding region domain-containing protein [Variovorax sp. J22R115]MDM0047451.1 NADH-ubiquinone oxidoreductase-F iron-sulfur binding region domain-containing protein [Variovorax sp. J22R115]
MHAPNQVLLKDNILVGADLSAWIERGGGEGLAKALREPAQVIAEIEHSDLRGMGGAGFATHRKWAPVAAAPDGDKYVVCNGNEDEPGTFKDRFLLEHTPHQVIEGALIAAVATRANHVIIYVNPHQPRALTVTREAVGQWREHEHFTAIEELLGGPLSLNVVPSSGFYIGGEETAVIATVEGGFPFPRRKPPFPAENGVHGAPTIVNNTETLAHVPGILRHGASWYRSLGLGNASGTKLYSLSGDVLRPGLYELPMGTSLEELVFVHGGGMLLGKEFKAVFTGGPSNTLLTKHDLDVPLDFDSVRQRRSRLGTGAMIVVSQGTSIVRKVAEYVNFFAQGSCGQCPPCKGGTFQLARVLNRIDTGRGVYSDLESLMNLCRLLPGSGRCGLIDGAVTVVESSLHHFIDEYEALLMA